MNRRLLPTSGLTLAKRMAANKGSVALEFALVLPVVLMLFMFSFYGARYFLIQALAEWNLHSIAREVSINQGRGGQGIVNRVIEGNSFGLFSRQDLNISVKACPSLKHWGEGDCTAGSFGTASWVVEYRLQMTVNLLNFAPLLKQSNIDLVTLVRNEPELPVKAVLR